MYASVQKRAAYDRCIPKFPGLWARWPLKILIFNGQTFFHQPSHQPLESSSQTVVVTDGIFPITVTG